MPDESLPIVDPNDPYAAQYEIAKRKLKKAQEDTLNSTAETYGARGRFYSGILPEQETKVKENYGQQLSDVAQNIAIERAAEEKAAQRTKEAQTYQTSERVASQSFAAGENALGRAFSTSERKAVQDFQTLSTAQQQNWQSAEAALGRKFSTQEREAVQAYQTGERLSGQTWQSAEAALGRQFTTAERTAVQSWQEAQDAATKAWQTLENDKGRSLTTAELLGYFTDSTGAKTYTMTGQQQNTVGTEAAEQLAAATKMGFKNVTEMNTYLADPEMAKKSGIYNNADRTEIKRLVAEGESGKTWLSDRYGLSLADATTLIGTF
jgi:hypothetical protein